MDHGSAYWLRTVVTTQQMAMSQHAAAQQYSKPAFCCLGRYDHVVTKCLYDSPSAKWQSKWEAEGGKRADLVAHYERNADYDGLAVGWGIGNKKASIEACGEACRAHKPKPAGGVLTALLVKVMTIGVRCFSVQGGCATMPCQQRA